MARRRSGRRSTAWPLIILITLLGLVVVAAVVVDRVAAGRAETAISNRLASRLGTATPPSVDIAGFPFLTQVLAGNLSRVRVVADQVGPTPGAPPLARRVDMVFTDVASDDRFVTTTARRAEGTAEMDMAALSTLAGRPLRAVGDGRVQTEQQTDVAGTPVTATVTGRPHLDASAQTVTLREAKLELAGVSVPDSVSQALVTRVVRPIPITGIPLGLTVQDLQVDDAGVRVRLAGDNVVLSE